MALGDTPQYLRRTALALQLTAHMHHLCGQLDAPGDPLLVRLAQGKLGGTISGDLARLFGLLHLDSGLDVGACFSVLLSTAMDLVLRFKHYESYPFALCFLCGRFNDSFRLACLDFLRCAETALDAGFALPLQRMAFAAGPSERERVAYLLSEPVQKAIELAFIASASSSLPVERKIAQTKRNEAPRLWHVSVASRNQILRQFLRERDELKADLAACERELKIAMRTNIRSLAWQQRKDLQPRGVAARRQQQGALGQRQQGALGEQQHVSLDGREGWLRDAPTHISVRNETPSRTRNIRPAELIRLNLST